MSKPPPIFWITLLVVGVAFAVGILITNPSSTPKPAATPSPTAAPPPNPTPTATPNPTPAPTPLPEVLNVDPIATWGGPGEEPGQLVVPYGSIVGPDGYLYITDCITGFIQKFTTDGELVLRFGGDTEEGVPGKFHHPSDLALDSEHNVYVVDELNHRIQVFDSDGNFLSEYGQMGSEFGQFLRPYGVAIDSKDNIYIVESGNNRVQKFDKDWNFITAWGRNGGDGTKGTEPGEFRNPWYAAIDDLDNLYVVDGSNQRIQKFDSDGNFLLMWGKRGDGPGEFGIPYEIDIDNAGNVYVVDINTRIGKGRIQVFDSAGNFLTSWASSSDREFNKLVSVDSVGNIYVTSNIDKKVRKLAAFPLGSPTKVQTPAAFPPASRTEVPAPVTVAAWGGDGNGPAEISRASGSTFDAEGFLYIADYNTMYIHKFSPDGEFISRFGGPTEEPADGKLMGPVDVTVDSEGNVYAVEWRGHRVQKFDAEGKFLMVLGEMGAAAELEGPGYGRFVHPYGVTVDSKDNVYVIDGGNQRVQKFDKDGNFLIAWGANGADGSRGQKAGEFSSPFMIAVDSKDNVYVVDQSNSRIQKFDSGGNFILMWGQRGSGPGELWNPLEMAIDSKDQVYVVELLNRRIQVFDSSGKSIYIWDVPWSDEDEVKTVAVDTEGYVYITTSDTRQVIKLSPFPTD